MLQIERINNLTIGLISCNDLDSDNSELFLSEIDPYLTAGACVILDMRELQYIDSSGLGVVLSCNQRLRELGGSFKLCGLSDTVRVMFEMVQMIKLFEIYPSRERAIEACS